MTLPTCRPHCCRQTGSMEGKILDEHLRPKGARVVCFADIDGTLVSVAAVTCLQAAAPAESCCSLQVHYPKEQACLEVLRRVQGCSDWPHTLQDPYGEFTRPSVVPNCWMWVDKVLACALAAWIASLGMTLRVQDGKRHKILKLPASTTGAQVCSLALHSRAVKAALLE